MITFILQQDTVKQLKKFISGLIPKKEDLYLYVNEKDEVYLVSFSKNHIYIAYLLLGVSKDISKGARIIQSDYIELKKFVKGLDPDDDVRLEPYQYNIWVELQQGDNVHQLHYLDNEDIEIDLDFFRGLNDKEFKVYKKDFKVLELYFKDYTRLSIGEGRIKFEIYNKDFSIFAEHTIYDTFQNEHKGQFELANKCLRDLLKKFNADGPIRLILDEKWPLLIEAGDFTGLLAPRILIEGDLRRLI